MRVLLFAIAALVVAASVAFLVSGVPSRQSADEGFNTAVARPAYPKAHPSVLFDEAHRNIHTADGLYAPFARLIANDGYVVVPNKSPFTRATLAGHAVLVIANALGSDDANTNSAFTDEECDAVRDWVQAGGALLLITDHAPTGSAAANLASRFGIEMSKGMVEDSKNHDPASDDTSQLVFSRNNGLLADHPITRGRDASESIGTVMTFTGQSLKASGIGAPFLKLAATALNRPPSVKVERSGGDVRVLIEYGDAVPATGYAQGIALEVGKGRVVVLGEAAMLTAQLDGKTRKPFGMNVAGIDNRQLALNIMHWLSRAL